MAERSPSDRGRREKGEGKEGREIWEERKEENLPELKDKSSQI